MADAAVALRVLILVKLKANLMDSRQVAEMDDLEAAAKAAMLAVTSGCNYMAVQ